MAEFKSRGLSGLQGLLQNQSASGKKAASRQKVAMSGNCGGGLLVLSGPKCLVKLQLVTAALQVPHSDAICTAA